MNHDEPGGHGRDDFPRRPWYREPWPWVAIAIPAIAVIGGLYTLYLAVSNPDPLVIDQGQYQEIRSELTAQPATDTAPPAADAAREEHDGER